MDTINNSILMCTSPSKNNQTYEYYTSSDCSDKLSYISPFRFYTQSSTRFSNDGTFDVKYDVIFSSSVTSRTAWMKQEARSKKQEARSKKQEAGKHESGKHESGKHESGKHESGKQSTMYAINQYSQCK